MKLQKGLMQSVTVDSLDSAEDSLAGVSGIAGFVSGAIIAERGEYKIQTIWRIDADPLKWQRVVYWIEQEKA